MQILGGSILEGEHHLEQRRPTQVALGLKVIHQLFEGQVLMRIRSQCCLSDAIEGITHSLCTLEFENHRPLYDWLIEHLPVPSRPHQYEFARLNLTWTVLSKRLLLRLVEEERVRGVDRVGAPAADPDPAERRLPVHAADADRVGHDVSRLALPGLRVVIQPVLSQAGGGRDLARLPQC